MSGVVRTAKAPAFLLLAMIAESARAGGGPLGMDHKWSYDDSGIYKRQIQKNLLSLMVAGDVAGALWEGDQSRLGKTLWQSVVRLRRRHESGFHAIQADPDQ